MAYYDALVTKWATLAPGTTAQKLAAINALMVPVPLSKAAIPTDDILNAIAPSEFPSATVPLQQLQLLIGGKQTVDASAGTTIRAQLLALFPLATAPLTRANLQALAQRYDTGMDNQQLWTLANGYSRVIGQIDLQNAGGLT